MVEPREDRKEENNIYDSHRCVVRVVANGVKLR